MSLNQPRLPLGVCSPVDDSYRNESRMGLVQASREPQVSSVMVTAPCTTANLGPGFDVFGLALDAFHDTVQIQSKSEEGVILEVAGADSRNVPRDPNLNSAGLVAKHLLSQLKDEVGVRIRLEKGIPAGKGLGSSAASAAATAVGLNRLLGLELTVNRLVEAAAQGEIASAGAPHADNVAACVLGGFTFVQSHAPFSVAGFALPRNLEVAIAIPEIPTLVNKTELARALLPESVPLGKIAQNIGGAASIVAGVLSGDVGLIGKGMVDAIVEPARARLVPGYAEVRQAALRAGAEGVAISGAGPSMIAIVDNRKVPAAPVAEAMNDAFESAGVECRALTSRPASGATILKG